MQTEKTQTGKTPRLEQRFYFWLFLLLSSTFLILVAIISYEEIHLFNTETRFFSTLLLNNKITEFEKQVDEFENDAKQWAGDIRSDPAGARSLFAGNATYHYEKVDLFILSRRQTGEVHIVRYGDSRRAPPAPVTEQPFQNSQQALSQRFAGHGLKTGWQKPLLLRQATWQLPYSVRLSEDQLLIMLAPLRLFFIEAETCHDEDEVSRFSASEADTGRDWYLAAMAEIVPTFDGHSFSPQAERHCLHIIETAPSTSPAAPDWKDIFLPRPNLVSYSKTRVPGMYIAISVATDELYGKLRYYLLSGFILILFVMVLLVLIIRRGIKIVSRSITDVIGHAERLSKGELDTQVPEFQRYQELQQFTNIVNNLAERLQDHISKLKQETMKSAARDHEVAIAGRIQQDLLTYDIEDICNRYQVDIGALLAPAKQIAGDFYFLTERPDGKLLFAVGDVSGKGIAAALVAKDCVNLLETNGKHLPLEELLRQMNAMLYKRFARQSMFVTLFCCLLDPESGALTHCDAGHETPLLCRDEQTRIERLPISRNMALGFLPDTSFKATATRLQQGDCLLLYTDGLYGGAEQQSVTSGVPLGVAVLCSNILKNVELQARLHCIHSLALEQQKKEAYDDITLLGVALQTSRYRSFHFPAGPDTVGKAIGRLQALLSAHNVSAGSRNRLCIALDEWVSNVIKYAEVDSDIIISCCIHSDEAAMEIIVRCRNPINPLERPELDIDTYLQSGAIGGLGVHVIRNMVDGLDYTVEDNWTRLEARVGSRE